jgi:hypothetical protein
MFAAGVLVGCLIGAVGSGLLRGSQNYHECMLDAMRGQPSQMYGSAYATCRARFPND